LRIDAISLTGAADERRLLFNPTKLRDGCRFGGKRHNYDMCDFPNSVIQTLATAISL
jgi:hypothetical protein